VRRDDDEHRLSAGEHIYLFLSGFGQAVSVLCLFGAIFLIGMLFGSLNMR
jgi:hypothetical protein